MLLYHIFMFFSILLSSVSYNFNDYIHKFNEYP